MSKDGSGTHHLLTFHICINRGVDDMTDIDPTPSLISAYLFIISNQNQARWDCLLSKKHNIIYFLPYN